MLAIADIDDSSTEKGRKAPATAARDSALLTSSGNAPSRAPVSGKDDTNCPAAGPEWVMPPTDLDRLYQLPLDEFTAARNALAKTAGTNSGAIRALTKPPLGAWAVNQLYWRDRKTWDALVAAAENLRRANKAVLSGRAGDVRAAGTVHDQAVQDALKATLEIVSAAGHPATDATKQAIANTLRALPADEPAGRLTRVLQPGGFEMLAGLSIAAGAPKEHAKPAKDHAKETKEQALSKADAKALTQAREAAASADRALK